jgi:hypothetical protein
MPANPPHYPGFDDPFPWHPYAELFPMMTEEELESLANDIEQESQKSPASVYNGMILDGRNRYAAIEIINVRRLAQGKSDKDLMSFTYGTFTNEVNPVNDARALASVKSHNLNRRFLTPRQRAKIAVELSEIYADIAKREEQWRKEHQNSPTFVNHKSPLHADKQAAKEVGAGQQSVSRLKTIKRQDPELYERVCSDDSLSINAAYNQIKPTKPKKEPEPEIEPDLTPHIVEVRNDEVLVAFGSSIPFLSPAEMECALTAIYQTRPTDLIEFIPRIKSEELQECLNQIYSSRKSDLMDFLAKLKITDPLLFTTNV